VHEVLRPPAEPSVIAAAAELVARLTRLNEWLAAKTDPLAGSRCSPLGIFTQKSIPPAFSLSVAGMIYPLLRFSFV
jgi:hypothetical protein